MTGFLTEIGSKLADRWVALLALPGLLYLAAVTAAAVLGQQHALSYPVLSGKITSWADGPVLKSAGGAVLIIAAVLAGSVLAGLAATAGGRFVEILWTLPGRHLPARWLTAWRRERSARAKVIADNPDSSPAQVGQGHPAGGPDLPHRARLPDVDRGPAPNLPRPHRRTYGLDLTAAWPRLWLIVPDTVRTELGGARDAFSAATQLTAWAIFYLILGAWWWPPGHRPGHRRGGDCQRPDRGR